MASRCIPKLLSELFTMFSAEIGFQKLGQPVPDSNLVFESYRAVSQQMQRYKPSVIAGVFTCKGHLGALLPRHPIGQGR